MQVDKKAWRALFAAQAGWILDAMDFLLYTFALIPIRTEFGLTNAEITFRSPPRSSPAPSAGSPSAGSPTRSARCAR